MINQYKGHPIRNLIPYFFYLGKRIECIYHVYALMSNKTTKLYALQGPLHNTQHATPASYDAPARIGFNLKGNSVSVEELRVS